MTGTGLRVLAKSGAPASSPVVLVTATSGKVLAIEHGNSSGIVRLSLAPGRYEVRIAAPEGFAVQEIDLARSLVSVHVDDKCDVVTGVVSEEIAPGQIAWLLTVPGGDYFGATVAQDRSFRACVPAGSYALEGDDKLAPWFVFASPANVRLDAYGRERIEVPPPDAVAVPSAASIGEYVSRDATVIGIGEANHGAREFVAVRLKESIALARTHNVRYIALEAGAAEVFPLDDYVHGARVDVRAVVSKLGYWMWDTEEFLAALDAIKKYNASAVTSDQLTLVGIDVQTAAAATTFLRSSAVHMTPQQQEALDVVSTADELAQLPEPRGSTLRDEFLSLQLSRTDSRDFRLELARLQIECRFAMLIPTTRVSGLLREEGMARMTDLLMQLSDGRGVVLWAHNGHINTDSNAEFNPLGARLRAAHGSKYIAVGLLMGSGEFRAWDSDHAIGVVTNRIDAPPAYTFEAYLLRHFTDAPAFISMHTLPRELEEWLSIPRRSLETGGQMAKEWRLRNHRKAFDVVGFIPRVSPTTPTSTGIRKAEP